VSFFRKVMMCWLMEKGEELTSETCRREVPENTVTLNSDVAPYITTLMKRAAISSTKGVCVLWYLLRLVLEYIYLHNSCIHVHVHLQACS